VMTSSAAGEKGASFGWINRDLISTDKFVQHFNPFGGEDRFWLGPEGGQFSIFFSKGAAFDLDHWFTPAAFDTEPFTVVSKTADSIVCHRDIQLTNYSGTKFSLDVNRTVRLVSSEAALAKLNLKVPAGVLSGPTFSDEVARDLPTAILLALPDPVPDDRAQQFQALLATPALRVYLSRDVAGVTQVIHACLEEIAWRQGWIDTARLEANIAKLGRSSYALYLRGLLSGQ